MDIKIAVFEDDPIHAGRILQHLKAWAESARSSVTCEHFSSPADVNCDIALSQFDCVMLDVKMPMKNGMEFARDIRRLNPSIPIVFISDYVEYGLLGYEVNATRFINKNGTDFTKKFNECMSCVAKLIVGNAKQYYALRGGSAAVSIPINDIMYIEIYDHLLYIHSTDNTFRERKTLAEISVSLPSQFVQCSRSHIINVCRVNRISTKDVEMSDGTLLPITK